jgi:hypothetical protein
MLENTEGTIKNGQSRETGNIRYTRRRKTKHNTTQFVTQVTQEKKRISVCQRPHLDLDLLSCAGY